MFIALNTLASRGRCRVGGGAGFFTYFALLFPAIMLGAAFLRRARP